MSRIMKALVLTAAEGPASVELKDVKSPAPGAGEVLVALKAASLNHRELWITRGKYPGMRLPCTLGCDGAGIVESVGAEVNPALLGTRVVLYPGLEWGPELRFPGPNFGLLGMPGPGTVAEQIVVPVENVAPAPSFLDFEEAAATALAGLTAWRGLTTKAGLAAGNKILITGIGGGVATFALKFAVAIGATAYVSSGSPATLEQAIKLGAKGAFNYNEPDWRKAVARQTGGLDVVFDGAPAAAYANYSRALKVGARVVIYGSTGGPQFPLNAPEVFLKNLQIVGTNVGNPREFRDMLAFVERHKIHPVIDRRFSFAFAKDALVFLESSHQFGKVVISI
jgi:zinc-binding alcohol dehydrogenase/oxidoreductase